MLRSYSFGIVKGTFPFKHWVIFDEAASSDLEYAYEIIKAVEAGRLQIKDDFNLSAYCAKVRRNQKLGKAEEASRVLRISDTDGDSVRGEDGDIDSCGVSMSNVIKYADQIDEFLKTDEEEDFYNAIDTLNRMQVDILIRYQVNFWHCMGQALRGIPEAIDLLHKLTEESPKIGELIWIVLSSGKSLSDLEQINIA